MNYIPCISSGIVQNIQIEKKNKLQQQISKYTKMTKKAINLYTDFFSARNVSIFITDMGVTPDNVHNKFYVQI